jgi:agmatinase
LEGGFYLNKKICFGPKGMRRPLYLTVDIDVCDIAFGQGMGSPEPGGITLKELLDSLALLSKTQVIGVDLA